MKKTLITFTSSVSDLTYAGHPSIDANFIDCSPREIPWPDTAIHRRSPNTDPVHTIIHLKNLLREFNQPVTWVINDNEYMNLNGTMPYLAAFQQEGDSILVTYEIVQRPSPVDRSDTEAVLRYAHARCAEAGLTIDGVWSLKFWNSDIEALLRLSREFPWAANLAGACWLQANHIDDAGWRGCPYGPYYPALHNIKGCQPPPTNGNLVMMHWLTRDFATGIQLDRIEPYGLDPADPSRPEIGGFAGEREAGAYVGELAKQLLANQSGNETLNLRIHEEVRHYFDEGHDKDIVIRSLYESIDTAGDRCRKTTLKEAFTAFRQENPHGDNPYLYSGTSLDPRYPREKIMLYEDGDCQMHFRMSAGHYPYRIYNYAARFEGGDSREYPVEVFPVVPIEMTDYPDRLEIRFEVGSRCRPGTRYAFAVWERPELHAAESALTFRHLKSHDGNHLLLFELSEGNHLFLLKK
jgi:hypothetical protein